MAKTFAQPGAEATGATGVCDMAMPELPTTSWQPRRWHCRVFGQSIGKGGDLDLNPHKFVEKKFLDRGSEATGVIAVCSMGTQDPLDFFQVQPGGVKRRGEVGVSALLDAHHVRVTSGVCAIGAYARTYGRACA
jgi:hypothetical protein